MSEFVQLNDECSIFFFFTLLYLVDSVKIDYELVPKWIRGFFFLHIFLLFRRHLLRTNWKENEKVRLNFERLVYDITSPLLELSTQIDSARLNFTAIWVIFSRCRQTKGFIHTLELYRVSIASKAPEQKKNYNVAHNSRRETKLNTQKKKKKKT